MIAFIKGTLIYSGADYVLVDNQGIGYKIFMPSSTLFRLPQLGETVTVHTYLYVREDIMSLYGFLDKEELDLFEILIQVSGIGPKGAIAILAAIPAPAFVQAIVNEQLSILVNIPGIGKKTAQRMIIELKDKLAKLSLGLAESANYNPVANESGEALEALLALGYAANEAKKAVNKVLTANPEASTEQIIKKALIELARF